MYPRLPNSNAKPNPAGLARRDASLYLVNHVFDELDLVVDFSTTQDGQVWPVWTFQSLASERRDGTSEAHPD